ncbi:MAG: prepilin peptidase [bacterium]
MLFYFFIFIFGLIIGSFLNVVILRLNNGEKISGSRSHCPHCQKVLSPHELWPVISFILQKGKCKNCKAKISWQYPLVELSTALLFILVSYVYWGNIGIDFLSDSWQSYLPWLRNLFFVCVLVVIFVYDLRWQLILDKVTLPAMAIALIVNLWLGYGFKNLLLGMLVAGGFFLAQFLISGGRWIGGGDIRMGALIGLMLGWPNTLVALFLSYVIGAFFGVCLMILAHKDGQTKVAFGSFLAVGTIIALLWGTQIMNKFWAI